MRTPFFSGSKYRDMARWKAICVVVWLPFFALLFGCGKSSPAPESASRTPAPSELISADTALRIHWQGKGNISAARNTTNLLKLLDLPETLKLQSQTLDKLSAAPWRMLLGQTNNAEAGFLRPLLDDLVAQECYFEIRRPADDLSSPGQTVLAVHLSADHVNVWQSNITKVMQALGGNPSASSEPAGWFLKSNSGSNFVEFARAGEWVLLSAAPTHSALLDETIARINNRHTPVMASSTNAFLEGFIDFVRLNNLPPSNTVPKVSFKLEADGEGVVTTGELQFSNGAGLKLETWDIPTNWISASSVTITAIRGLAPFLRSSKAWENFNAGPPPDQCFTWATSESPMQTYFAAPMPSASNAVAEISEFALRKQGPFWLTNVLAGFKKSENSDGLSWNGFPFIAPFLHSAGSDGHTFLLAGFLNIDIPAGPPPEGVIDGILSKTNLVYYDRELSGIRIEQWIQLGQALRFISGAAQFPADSASFQWIKAVSSHLGTCNTEITQIAPGKFLFVRKSDLGLSAIELHALADWLESPEFPQGTYSLLVRSSEPLR